MSQAATLSLKCLLWLSARQKSNDYPSGRESDKTSVRKRNNLEFA